jgi:hypothetical protein
LRAHESDVCRSYPDEYDHCTYGAPSVAAWAAVAVAVSSPKLPIPPSSGYTAIGLALAAVLTVFAKVCPRVEFQEPIFNKYNITALLDSQEIPSLHSKLECHWTCVYLCIGFIFVAFANIAHVLQGFVVPQTYYSIAM